VAETGFNFNSYLVVDKVTPIIVEKLKKFDRQPWQPALLLDIIEVITEEVHKYIQRKNLVFADESNIMSIIANRISISLSNYDPHEEPSDDVDAPKTIQQHIDRNKEKIMHISFHKKLSLQQEQREFEQAKN